MSAPTDRPEPPPPLSPRPAAAPPDPDADAAKTTARAWVIVAVVVLSLALVALMVAALTRGGEDQTGQQVSNEPRTVEGSTVGGRQDAQFELVGGAETVHVTSSDLGDVLYRVATPDGGVLVPKVVEDGNRVQLSLSTTGGVGPATVDVLLNANVRWQLKLAGGGLLQNVAFATGRLAGVEFTAGSSEIDVTVPKPEGSLPIKLSAGAGKLAVHAPTGAPAQVRLGGGAGTVTVDGAVRTGVAGGTLVTQPGWAQAADRYDIDLAVGVSTVTVDRR